MPLVTWNDSFSVGIPEIDRQHKQLIEQLNTLIDALDANQSLDKIQTIVQFIERYATQHFRYEEDRLHCSQCPVVQDAAHRQFTQTLQEVKDELEQKGTGPSLTTKVKEHLLDWLIHHIKQIDNQIQPHLSETSSSSRQRPD